MKGSLKSKAAPSTDEVSIAKKGRPLIDMNVVKEADDVVLNDASSNEPASFLQSDKEGKSKSEDKVLA